MWVCLKMLCTPKPNGFADHYPYEKWLFHWEYTQHFQTNPCKILWGFTGLLCLFQETIGKKGELGELASLRCAVLIFMEMVTLWSTNIAMENGHL